jgi:hypothetical protein
VTEIILQAFDESFGKFIYFAGRLRMESTVSPMQSLNLDTITRFRYSSISLVVSMPWVPTKRLINKTGWGTWRLNTPNALKR